MGMIYINGTREDDVILFNSMTHNFIAIPIPDKTNNGTTHMLSEITKEQKDNWITGKTTLAQLFDSSSRYAPIKLDADVMPSYKVDRVLIDYPLSIIEKPSWINEIIAKKTTRSAFYSEPTETQNWFSSNRYKEIITETKEALNKLKERINNIKEFENLSGLEMIEKIEEIIPKAAKERVQDKNFPTIMMYVFLADAMEKTEGLSVANAKKILRDFPKLSDDAKKAININDVVDYPDVLLKNEGKPNSEIVHMFCGKEMLGIEKNYLQIADVAPCSHEATNAHIAAHVYTPGDFRESRRKKWNIVKNELIESNLPEFTHNVYPPHNKISEKYSIQALYAQINKNKKWDSLIGLNDDTSKISITLNNDTENNVFVHAKKKQINTILSAALNLGYDKIEFAFNSENPLVIKIFPHPLKDHMDTTYFLLASPGNSVNCPVAEIPYKNAQMTYLDILRTNGDDYILKCTEESQGKRYSITGIEINENHTGKIEVDIKSRIQALQQSKEIVQLVDKAVVDEIKAIQKYENKNNIRTRFESFEYALKNGMGNQHTISQKIGYEIRKAANQRNDSIESDFTEKAIEITRAVLRECITTKRDEEYEKVVIERFITNAKQNGSFEILSEYAKSINGSETTLKGSQIADPIRAAFLPMIQDFNATITEDVWQSKTKAVSAGLHLNDIYTCIITGSNIESELAKLALSGLPVPPVNASISKNLFERRELEWKFYEIEKTRALSPTENAIKANESPLTHTNKNMDKLQEKEHTSPSLSTTEPVTGKKINPDPPVKKEESYEQSVFDF